MRSFKLFLLTFVLLLIEFPCWISFVKGQEYVFTGPEGTHFIPSSYQQNPTNEYINTAQDLSPFRRSSPGFPAQLDSYLPQRDLQTSDLPIHLQQTLPQYRYTTHETPTKNFQQPLQYTFQNSNPSPFSPHHQFASSNQENIIPSTHRPNYSHLFAQGHNRNPSQTETFLGQITLQSPEELPPQFDSFKPIEFPPHQDLEITDKPNTVQLGNSGRSNFLNHRTRILAPDGNGKKANKPLVKDYFVNTNGDVYITTKIPFSPKPTSPPRAPTTVERKNPFSPTPKPSEKPHSFNLRPNKIPFVPKNAPLPASSSAPSTTTPNTKNSFNLESLLEEPIKDSNTYSHDDDVEVVKSHNKEVPTTSYKVVESEEEEDYDDDDNNNNTPLPHEYEDSQEGPEQENDIIQNDDYPEEHSAEKEKEKEETPHTKVYDVLTDKPIVMVKDDNFKQFVDTVAIDNTTEDQSDPTTTVRSTSVNTSISKEEKLQPQPELVVSVVTTKSVVNNTIIPPPTNEELTSPATPLESEENSTDTWVVVASVQTSRSVSGARYLPSPNVEQDERIKLLNEHSEEEEEIDDESPTKYDGKEEEVTTIMPTTTQKLKTSTESLIDKLDRVQSDLSSGLLTDGFKNDNNNIAVITENMPEKMDVTTMLATESTTTTTTTTTTPKPAVVIRKFSPNARPTTTKRPKKQFTRKPTTTTISDDNDEDIPQGDDPTTTSKNSTGSQDVTSHLPEGYKPFKDDNKNDKNSKLLQQIFNNLKSTISSTSSTTPLTPEIDDDGNIKNATNLIESLKKDDISAFLPPGYKPPPPENSTEENLLSKIKPPNDISAFLPPGYKPPSQENRTEENLPSKIKPPNATDTGPVILKAKEVSGISDLLNKDSKPKDSNATSSPIDAILSKAKPVQDLSALLPPGYKPPTTKPPQLTEKPEKSGIDALLSKAKPVDDISALLPPGYKSRKLYTTSTAKPKPSTSGIDSLLAHAKPVDDISGLLPPGFKARKEYKPTTSTTTEGSKSKVVESMLVEAKPVDISAFLPPGFKPEEETKPSNNDTIESTTSPNDASNTTTNSTTKKTSSGSSGFKVVFPSRPGGGTRKSATRLTTPKYKNDDEAAPKLSGPTIQKGWPTRATTEFTGWPSPSTTPISVEDLLKAARTASTSTTSEIPISTNPTTTTTTTTTTTPKPTTPGICLGDCDLAGTIKLVGGAKWAPELLDRNTKEWQILANEVQSQLEDVYSKSTVLNKWYKKIRIDGFSEGSVLVDYLVELNDLGRKINTAEIKTMFHESLEDALSKASSREGKSLNETAKLEGKLSLGNFIVDPMYTDFVVLPKQAYPTVGYAEDNVLLPQWAIAVIVIGLASLLFVIIFGVTVLVNRQKNAKKKAPIPLTDDMLNELNKNHMGGFDNYGADDLYNMEDVWNDRGYDTKPPKKRSNGSIHDNSMSNLYDSWRSEWNGYYYNAYYGNNPGNPGNPGSSHSGGYGRRRSDYDTNF